MNKPSLRRFWPIVFLGLLFANHDLAAENLVWVNTGGGNWNVPGNWEPARVPAPGDTVQITNNGNYTVILNVAATLDGVTLGGNSGIQSLLVNSSLTLNGNGNVTTNGVLNLAGGTLDGTGALTVAGQFNWSGGTLSGSGMATLLAGATGLWSGGSTKVITVGYTLNNAGSIVWTNTGTFTIRNGSFNNSGVLEMRSDATLNDDDGGGNGFFNNSGTFRKTMGPGTPSISSVTVNNSGTFELLSGSLIVNSQPFHNSGLTRTDAGTLTLAFGGLHTGTFEAIGNGIIAFTGGTHQMTNGARMIGSGLSSLDGATLSIEGSVGAQSFQVTGGTLSGSGTLYITNLFNWSGGSMSGSGNTYLLAGATGLWSGGSTKVIGAGYTLHNAGSIVWTNTGTFTIRDGSFNNSGVLEMRSDATINDDNGGANGFFNNSGTFRKTMGTGTPSISSVTVNNSGTFELLSGSLIVNSQPFHNSGLTRTDSGTLTLAFGGVHTGTFEAIGNGIIAFTGGTHYLTNGARMIGSGLSSLDGATLSIEGAVGAQSFQVTGGTLSGSGTLYITNLFNWSGGSMSGSGNTYLLAGATGLWSGGSTKVIAAGYTLHNAGSIVWTNTGTFTIRDGSFNNSGVLEMRSDATINDDNGGGNGFFNNSGTFRKTMATGTPSISSVTVNNSGTFELLSGSLIVNSQPFNNSGLTRTDAGTLTLAFGGVHTGTFEAIGNGIIAFTGGAHQMTNGARMIGSGLSSLDGATLSIEGSVGAQSFQITGGTLSGSGTLYITNLFNWSGGSMSGSGNTYLLAGATGLWSGGSTKVIAAGYTLHNAGSIVWTNSGTFTIRNGSFNNSGMLEMRSDATLNDDDGGANGFFNNSGTFRKTMGTGTPSISSVTVNNSGTFELLSGSLIVNGQPFNNSGLTRTDSGTLTLAFGGVHTGTFEATGNGIIAFTGGAHQMTNGARMIGSGLSSLDGATLSIEGSVGAQSFQITGGTLSGSGTLYITNLFNWSGGTLSGSGMATLLAGATGLWSGGSSKVIAAGYTLHNAGSIVWTNTGTFTIRNGSFNNSGVLEMRSDATINDDDGGSNGFFNNSGTFRKTMGPGTPSISSVTVNNSGTFELLSGSLIVNSQPFNNSGLTRTDSGTLTLAFGGLHTGTFEATGNGNIAFTGGTHQMTNGARMIGSGLSSLDGATLSIEGSVGAQSFQVTGGTLSGSGTLYITNLFNWSGGSMSGSGNTYLLAGATGLWSGASTKVIAAGYTLNNAGSIVWTNTGTFTIRNGSFNNSGVLEMRSDATINDDDGGSNGFFNNSGTFRKTMATAASAISSIGFTNSGIIELRSGILSFNSAPVLTPAGTVQVVIGGLTPAVDFGQINVSGTFPLDGSLQVSLANNYSPGFGETYTFLTAGTRQGSFSSFIGGNLGNGNYFNPAYRPTGVDLKTVNATPLIGGLRINRASMEFRFQITGLSGESYIIEASTNAVDRAAWSAISTNTIPPEGVLDLVLPDYRQFPQRYFRARFVDPSN